MLSHMKGILTSIEEHGATVEVGGIGFHLAVSDQTRKSLSSLGSPVSMHTHLHVREDALQLFGFSTLQEKKLFEILISVSGIGPKGALSMLSRATPQEFQHAIASQDIPFLTSIQGIGKKTAERLIVELKEKIDQIDFGEGGYSSLRQIEGNLRGTPYQEALEALIVLGYSYHTAQRTIQTVRLSYDEKEVTVENVIRKSLKLLRDQ